MNTARIERVRITGSLSTTSGSIEIENNVWLVGNDDEVVIIDASHDAARIVQAVHGRTVRAILLTHGHTDHVNVAPELRALTGADLYLNTADQFLWDEWHPVERPQHDLRDGEQFTVAGITLRTVHTPGHTPGSVCFVIDELGTVLSGDTLFEGGPGATRWEYSSFPQIIDSIERAILSLDDLTRVLPGHGASTTVGAEQAQMHTYIDRGW